jgi:drug/metabolite transporter (DMT)-like permease
MIKLEWLVFALLSPAFWGLNNVVNKFLVSKKFQGYFSISIYLNLVDLIFAATVFVFTPISFQFPYSLFAMVVGLLPVFAFWFYTKALKVEEVSRLTPLFQFIPIFVVLMSVVFLDEILSAQRYFGIALIVLTSLLISYKKTQHGNSLTSTLKLMIPFSIILAVNTVLNKYLLNYMDYWSAFFWMMIGSALAVLCMLVFPKPRKEFKQTLPLLGKRTFFTALLGEGTYIMGLVFSLIATALGYVSLVSALSGLQHFFVFIYMILLSLFVPNILKEELHSKVVIIKTVAIALMFVGTWLITT